jgi:CMP-N,N'-diacetyllegionaminic acid synthase
MALNYSEKIQNEHRLALIPARSGSKRIPDKNIKPIGGLPLLAYSIIAAINSKLFDEIIVSTDSEKYAELATRYGANVPYIRSENLSSDSASSFDVVLEAIDYFKSVGKVFDSTTLLQPTSPLRTAEDICMAMDIYNKRNANSVVSVCETKYNPDWINPISADGNLKSFSRSQSKTNSCGPFYCVNGAIYIIRNSFLKTTKDIYFNNSFAYFMDSSKSVDIDTLNDWDYAEYLISSCRFSRSADGNNQYDNK